MAVLCFAFGIGGGVAVAQGTATAYANKTYTIAGTHGKGDNAEEIELIIAFDSDGNISSEVSDFGDIEQLECDQIEKSLKIGVRGFTAKYDCDDDGKADATIALKFDSTYLKVTGNLTIISEAENGKKKKITYELSNAAANAPFFAGKTYFMTGESGTGDFAEGIKFKIVFNSAAEAIAADAELGSIKSLTSIYGNIDELSCFDDPIEDSMKINTKKIGTHTFTAKYDCNDEGEPTATLKLRFSTTSTAARAAAGSLTVIRTNEDEKKKKITYSLTNTSS